MVILNMMPLNGMNEWPGTNDRMVDELTQRVFLLTSVTDSGYGRRRAHVTPSVGWTLKADWFTRLERR